MRMAILQSVADYDTVLKIGLYVAIFVLEKLFLSGLDDKMSQVN